MKRFMIITNIVLVLGLGLALTLIWLLSSRVISPASASTLSEPQQSTLTIVEGRTSYSLSNATPIHYVAITGTNSGDCSTPGDACQTIQYAVDQAGDGDGIRVAAGDYANVSARAGITQVIYISKTVTIQGGYTATNWTTPDPDANPTTLDAQGQGRVLYITGDISSTIEGLRITGGNADGLGGSSAIDAGGGVYVVTATVIISNNYIFSNTSHYGGGLYLSNSPAAVVSNTFRYNTALWSGGNGGGLYLCSSDATLTGNDVVSNTARNDGGGFYLYLSAATLSDNTVRNNSADEGGGVNLSRSNAMLNGNTIISNTGGGGGVHLGHSAAMLDRNIIMFNSSDWWGGGLYLQHSDATLTNNVIVNNQADAAGSGLYIASSSPLMLHNTIARNIGGDGIGIYVTDELLGNPSVVALTNTILVSHTVGITITAGNTATLNGVLWYNNTSNHAGAGVIIVTNEHTGTPSFVDPDAGDYHIGSTSAARDAAIIASVDSDIDDHLRPMGWGYDIGADEYPDAALVVVKRPLAAFVNPNQVLTYTIIVTNSGMSTATGMLLTDTLDEWQRPVTATASTGNCELVKAGWGGSAVCTPGAVVTNTTLVVTLTAQVSTAVAPGQAIVNTVVVTTSETADSVQVTNYAQECKRVYLPLVLRQFSTSY